jgi:transporter family protein
MSWVFYILLANVLFSATQIFDKYFNSKKIKNVYSYSVILNSVYFLFVAVTAYIIRDSFVVNSSFFWSILAGFCYFLMWIFFWKALQTGEVSRVTAIFFTQPVFNAFLAIFFLGESISQLRWLGIILIVFGAIGATWEGKGLKITRSYVLLAVLAAIVSAVGNTVSKYAMLGLPPLAVNSIGYFATVPLYIFLLTKKEVFREVKSNFTNRPTMFKFFVRGLIGYAAIAFFMLAIGAGPVSLVSAMSGTQPLFTLILSLIIASMAPNLIKENISRSAIYLKASAIILIVSGAIIISL